MHKNTAYQSAISHILAIFDDRYKNRLAQYHALTFQADKICLLYAGDYSLVRRRDGLLLTRSRAPGITGMIMPGTPEQYVILHADSDCDYRLVSNKDFFSRIDECKAHQDMYTLLLAQVTRQQEREELLLGGSSMVCVQGAILLLSRLEPDMLASINVANFVIKMTNLSRSIVMKSVAFLREENAIEMSKGKLVRVNYLPDIP